MRSLNRIAVITHFYSPGPAHELVDYLVPRVDEVVFVGRPLPAKRDQPSFYRSYRDGKLEIEKSGAVRSLPDLVRYITDFFAIFWFLITTPPFDLVVSLDPLNTTAVRFAQVFGRVRSFVYYTIDYIPNRFSNQWLNRFYHWLDRLSVTRSNWTWNLSPRMTKARAKRWQTHRFDSKQLIMPMGTHPLKVDLGKKALKTVIFMGHLRAGQGVGTLIDAVAIAIRKIPKLQVMIVGGGELLDTLKQRAAKRKLSSQVTFTGFVADNATMRDYLMQATVAIAPYQATPDNYTYFSDPGKPKEYLAAGLPVLISDVPQIAEVIANAHAGMIVQDTPASIATGIVTVLKDPKVLRAYQESALSLARSFDWNTQFSQTFEAMGYDFDKRRVR